MSHVVPQVGISRNLGLSGVSAFVLPGAILGALFGLALAGRQLAILMPSIVHVG